LYKTIPIVAVRPVDEYFIITWRVDLKCNFDCMYCPTDFHSLTAATKTLKELQFAWNKMFEQSVYRGLKYKISFTGGEISINKDFLPFIKWLYENFAEHLFQVGITSNGSASVDYYLDLLKYVDFVTFSTHSEFFNERKFFDNVVTCSNAVKDTNKTVQVSIMDEPWHQDRIATYIKFFKENNINHSLNKIDFSYQIRENNITNHNKQLYNFKYESKSN
jgi:MoaA/NifB/PqqE/SkfB family radical SAM enzyme